VSEINIGGLNREELVRLIGEAVTRLLLMRTPAPESVAQPRPGDLLTAKQLAELWNIPETWIVSEARAGRIPKVMVGRYPRFDPVKVRIAIESRDENQSPRRLPLNGYVRDHA
jgi:hypothetical protein